MYFIYTKQNRFVALACCLLLCGGLYAGVHPAFSSSDVFQSAVFQANNALIPDYKDEKIWFFSNHDHVKAYFTESGVLYKLGPVPAAPAQTGERTEQEAENDEAPPVSVTYALVKMTWLGANPHPQIVPGKKAAGYHTYLDKDDKGFNTLKTEGYKTIIYKDLYPGVDVEYSFPDKGGIKYNLVVKPGADARQVKLAYDGVESLMKNAAGDVVLSTPAGELIEHAPVCFLQDGQQVPSYFGIADSHTLQFNFPAGYDSHQTLTIDPWVTAVTVFSPDNIGFDVDYDTTGNAFVYGAGPTSTADANDYFEVAKYSITGTNVWVFNGSVTSISWNSWSAGLGKNYAGNILVEKSTGKIYVAKGHDATSTSVIRLNTAGAYDNFQSALNTNFQEDWGIGYNCVNSTLLALGGGVSSNINMAVINTTNGATTNSNITGNPLTHQDIICGVFDNTGNLYVIMDDYTDPTAIPYVNTMYRVNAGLNGYTWVANSGYTPFSEEWNANFWQVQGSTNWNNCLAANGDYLYYYDGLNLKAFNLATGTTVGNPTTIAGYQATYQGGIAVDNCDNVYVGGIGAIKTFHFDGTNFNAAADISLGAGFTTKSVEDVKYNSQTNTLYITGVGVVGTYPATLSVSCNPISVTNTCTSATATLQGISGATFTYTWTNTSGTVVSQTNNSNATSNTATGLAQGTYYVRVAWQANCNGSTISDSVTITCPSDTVTVNDTTICLGGTATLTAHGTPTGGTYSWSPGGATGATITVSPTSTSTYTVTYTPLTGPAVTAVSTVTVNTTAPTVTVNSPTICAGSNATLTANPSIGGGTYLWNPGGLTTSSITVSPATTTTYTVTYTTSPCGTATATATVTVNNAPTVTVNSASVCAGGTATLTAAPSVGGGTYLWSPGGQTTNSISVTPNTNTSYTVTYTSPLCGTASATATVSISTSASVTVNSVSICTGSSAELIATASVAGGTYSWAPGGATTDSISVSPGGNTTYTVTYTPVGCAAATNSGTVTVNPLPTVTLTPEAPGCAHGGVITATAGTGTGPYQYALNGGNYQQADSFTNLGPGNDTVVVKDANGCVSAAVITTIATYTPLSLGLTIDSITCLITTGQITGTAAGGTSPYQYSINGGALQNSGTFTGLAAGVYIIVAQDAAGCTTADTTNIPVPGNLVASASADSVICFGSATGKVIGGVTGGSVPYQYALNGGVFQPGDTFNNIAAGNYTVEVKDANGCQASATVQVFQPDSLYFVSVTVTPVKCPGQQNGTITVVAAGGTQPYSYAGTTDSVNFIYATGGILTGLDTGTYIIILSDNNGCTIATSAYVPGPVADSFAVQTDSTSCFGSEGDDGAIIINALVAQNAPFTYSLNNGVSQTSDSFANLAAGNYTMVVTNMNGCQTTLSNITVAQPAEAFAIAYPTDSTIQLGQSLPIYSYLAGGSSPTGITYAWSPAEGLSCIDCASPVATPYSEQTTYTVAITYNGHCTADTSIVIYVNFAGRVWAPSAFTPNNDGNNDVFYLYGYGIKELDLKIFNRWGEKVFESTNQYWGWDGMYKGVLQMPAVFVYEANITFLDNTTRFLKGSVTLIR